MLTLVLQEFNDELVLRLGQFSVWPAYFEIGPQEVIEVNILFEGVGFGLATEKMVMICDNNSYEEIDLVADVIMFEKELFTVEVELIFEHFYKKKFKNGRIPKNSISNLKKMYFKKHNIYYNSIYSKLGMIILISNQLDFKFQNAKFE